MNIKPSQKFNQSKLFSYIFGYIFSLILTLVAFWLVNTHLQSHHETFSQMFLTFAVIGLAIIQLYVQIIFFLNLGRGDKLKWNILVLLFAGFIVIIIVGGSLWIMNNLNYRMMPNQKQINQYMQDQTGL